MKKSKNERIEVELKAKNPGLAERAYEGNGATAAIRLFCLACMGGSSNEVKNCSDTVCSLYRFRFGKLPNKRAIDPNRDYTAGLRAAREARESAEEVEPKRCEDLDHEAWVDSEGCWHSCPTCSADEVKP